MKVFINTDLEGVCSFVDWEEVTFKSGRGVEYTKHFLTAEVNAAIEGALEVDGDAKFTVLDGHGGGHWGPNMISEDLNPAAELIMGKRGVEIIGLDESFDLYIEIGTHSMAGTMHGLMNHTISHDRIMNFWINDVKVGEIGIRAAIAGYYGVPVGLVSGDYWAVEEAYTLLGDIERVAVKKGFNMFSAQCLNPRNARELIKKASHSAAAFRMASVTGVYGRTNPYKDVSPVSIKIEYMQSFYADRAELKGAERLDGRTVQFVGDDFIETLNRSGA